MINSKRLLVMIKKVQTVGINKDYLIKIHKEILSDILSRGFNPSEDVLEKINQMCVIQSKVFLFGLNELPQETNDFTRSILERFPSDYQGINHFVEENINKRSYSFFTEFLIDILKKTDKHIVRSLIEIDSSKEEALFLATVLAFEEFLEEHYLTILLPRLLEIEEMIKKGVTDIYNSDMSEQEIVDAVDEYLEQQLKDLSKQYQNEVNKNMFEEAVSKSQEVAKKLGLEKADVFNIKKTVIYGYLSNINAFFYNEIRRIKEYTYENIFSGANKRSLATKQLESVFFNQNVYKLSTIIHGRALFRAIIEASAKNYTHFKAVIPLKYISNLAPTGLTIKALYLIKTRNEWSDFIGNKNANVVGGLSLHHGDRVYYYPVKNNDLEIELAKKQRKQLLSVSQ